MRENRENGVKMSKPVRYWGKCFICMYPAYKFVAINAESYLQPPAKKGDRLLVCEGCLENEKAVVIEERKRRKG